MPPPGVLTDADIDKLPPPSLTDADIDSLPKSPPKRSSSFLGRFTESTFPMLMKASGATQAITGVSEAEQAFKETDPEKKRKLAMGSAADIIEPGIQMATEAFGGPAAVAERPVVAGLTVAGGELISMLTKLGVSAAGGGPEAQDLAGDITGLLAGIGLYKLFPETAGWSREAKAALRSATVEALKKTASANPIKWARNFLRDPGIAAAIKSGQQGVEVAKFKATKPERTEARKGAGQAYQGQTAETQAAEPKPVPPPAWQGPVQPPEPPEPPELPSGRVPGSYEGAQAAPVEPEPEVAARKPVWQGVTDQPVTEEELPQPEPAPEPELPSGRKVPTPEERARRAEEPPEPVSPEQRIARRPAPDPTNPEALHQWALDRARALHAQGITRAQWADITEQQFKTDEGKTKFGQDYPGGRWTHRNAIHSTMARIEKDANLLSYLFQELGITTREQIEGLSDEDIIDAVHAANYRFRSGDAGRIAKTQREELLDAFDYWKGNPDSPRPWGPKETSDSPKKADAARARLKAKFGKAAAGAEPQGPVSPPPSPREGTPEAEAIQKAKEQPDLSDQLQASIDAVNKKIRDSLSRSNAGIPVDTLADLAKWGALRIAKGAVDFAGWSAEMVRNFGERVRPHLQDLWAKSQELAKSFMDERGSFSRKRTDVPVSPPKPRGYQFVSPNVEEGLNYEQAKGRLGSERHTQFVQHFTGIDEDIPGMKTEHRSAIGDWADGAENSVVVKVYEGTPEDNRYSAARKGTISEQKQVIAFNTDPAGGDSVFEFDLGVDAPTAQKLLSDAGIQYRTLEESGRDQTHVYVFDPGNQLPENLEKLQGLYGRPIKIAGTAGAGEFLGGDTREAGREAFRQIIEGYESARPRRGGKPGREGLPVPGRGGVAPAPIGGEGPPAPEQKLGLQPAEPVAAPATIRDVSALMETPLELPGKGLVTDMGAALDKMVGPENRLDRYSDPEERKARAEEFMRRDAEYGLAKMPTSRGWYTKMVEGMEKTLARFRPEFRGQKGAVNRSLFKYVLGITSVGVNPTENFRAAMLAWELYQRQGYFSAYDLSRASEYNPGKGVGLTRRANSYEDGLNRLNQLITNQGGAKNAVDWLKSKHSVKELEKYWPKIPDKTSGDRYGSYIFGPKVGSFGANLNGIHTELTADKWWSRSWNRWMGTVMATDAKGNPKFDPKTKEPLIQDDPLNEGERNLMREVAAKVAGDLGLDVDELQAVLWYTEQALYRAHGIRAGSIGYDDASEIYFGKRGIQPEEVGGNRAPPKGGGPVPISTATQRSAAKTPARVPAAGPKSPPARRRLAR